MTNETETTNPITKATEKMIKSTQVGNNSTNNLTGMLILTNFIQRELL